MIMNQDDIQQSVFNTLNAWLQYSHDAGIQTLIKNPETSLNTLPKFKPDDDMITMHSRESCWEHMIPANYATVRWQENRWLFIWILQWKQAVADAAWIRSSNNDQRQPLNASITAAMPLWNNVPFPGVSVRLYRHDIMNLNDFHMSPHVG